MTKNSGDIEAGEGQGEPEDGPQLAGTEDLEAALREALESKEAREAATGQPEAGEGEAPSRWTR